MHPKIAIYGEYKTGTTACFLMIREALPVKPRELFEEPFYQPRPDDDQYPILAKVIIPPDPDSGEFW